MRRLLVVALGFAITLGTAVAVASWYAQPAAVLAGRKLYWYRTQVEGKLRPWARPGAFRDRVVWIGDSTILGFRNPSYPQILEPELRRRGAQSRVLGAFGLDSYGQYFTLGRVLATLDPSIVVLVAHLRLFTRPGDAAAWEGRKTYTDLASLMPMSELGRTLGLPLHQFGVSAVRLALLQSLKWPPAEQVFYGAEGLRAAFQKGGAEADGTPLADHMGNLRAALRASDVEIGPAHPLVRMLQGAVSMATERGVRCIVVGTPIPWQGMQTLGLWDEERFAMRFDVLRRAVEGAGGTFLDLHRELDATELRDAVGHFNRNGARHMVRAVRPTVLGALQRPSARGERGK